MTRNLILSGGIFHPFEETSAMLAEILQASGIDSEIVEIKAGLARLAAGETTEMLTVNALCWGMTQHEKYAPFRAEFAHALSEAERRALQGHVESGRPLLAMHTAPICFDDWPEWGALIGAGWVWGQSGHPAPCPVSVSGGWVPEPFDVEDELYGGLTLAADSEVLALGRTADDTTLHPVLVRRRTPGVRVVYDALGHDARSFEHPQHRALVGRAADWLTGQGREAGQ